MRKILGRIIFCFVILFGYNLVASNFALAIPINIFTLLAVFFLDIPGLIAIIMFKIMCL